MSYLKQHLTSRREKVVALVLFLALTATAGAMAAWLMNGDGSAGGRGGTAESLMVVPTDPSTGYLYPGGTGAAAFVVTNPNGFPVTVTAAHFDGAVTAPSSSCDATGITLAQSDVTGLSVTIAAGQAETVEIPGVFQAIEDLSDDCQGAALRVHTVVNARSGS